MWVSAAGEGLEKLLETECAELPPWFVIGFGSGIAAWSALDTAVEWQTFLCVAAWLLTRPGAVRMGCEAAVRTSGRRQRCRKTSRVHHPPGTRFGC